jgi:hypothetical protein
MIHLLQDKNISFKANITQKVAYLTIDNDIYPIDIDELDANPNHIEDEVDYWNAFITSDDFTYDINIFKDKTAKDYKITIYEVNKPIATTNYDSYVSVPSQNINIVKGDLEQVLDIQVLKKIKEIYFLNNYHFYNEVFEAVGYPISLSRAFLVQTLNDELSLLFLKEELSLEDFELKLLKDEGNLIELINMINIKVSIDNDYLPFIGVYDLIRVYESFINENNFTVSINS